MEVVTLPRVIFLDEENIVPVFMQNAAQTASFPDCPYTNITVRYSRASDTALQSFSPTVDQWSDRGRGFYALTLPDTVATEEGMFHLEVEPATGGSSFIGLGSVDRHEEDRILGTPGSGHGEGTIGQNIFDAGNEFEVFASPQYDPVLEKYTVVAWLHRNGVVVSDPTSCRVIVKDMDSGDTLFDQVDAAPDADGIFYLEQTGIVLDPKLNTAVNARITYAGEDYRSFEGSISLN